MYLLWLTELERESYSLKLFQETAPFILIRLIWKSHVRKHRIYFNKWHFVLLSSRGLMWIKNLDILSINLPHRVPLISIGKCKNDTRTQIYFSFNFRNIQITTYPYQQDHLKSGILKTVPEWRLGVIKLWKVSTKKKKKKAK